jgi:hypothetical protein
MPQPDTTTLYRPVGPEELEVERHYLKQFKVRTVGGSEHTEYWIPAEQLVEFNRHIVGKIEVVAEFR